MTAPSPEPVRADGVRERLIAAHKQSFRDAVARMAGKPFDQTGVEDPDRRHATHAKYVDALLAGPVGQVIAERDALQAELDAVDRAFEGLDETDRARRIGHWIGTAADECTKRQEAEARAATLATRLAKVEGALKPFAAYADPRGRMPADMPVTAGSSIARRQLTMGDCYAAVAALSPDRPATGNRTEERDV